MGTILKCMLVYSALLLYLRLIPRRIGNIMAPFEYVLLFLLGGIAVQGVAGDDHSLVNAALGVSTVALMHTLVSKLKLLSGTFGKVVDGTPVPIIHDGRWDEREVANLALLKQDILAAARQQQIGRTDEIRLAIVERNGGISLFKHQTANVAGQATNETTARDASRRSAPESRMSRGIPASRGPS